jgi:tripartite-type tricarboxylate transporter receptor subunit TctC
MIRTALEGNRAVPFVTKTIVRCLSVAVLAALWPPGADAASNGFYSGKTITFVIGSAAGGGYDTYSRLAASHLGRHLEGAPPIVVQNMPGAGSIRAANHLYNVARKDGTTIGMVDEALYLNQILGTPELQADATKFNWIGRILANSAVLFARREAAAQRIEDVFQKELIVSTSGAASRLNWTVLKNTLGMKFTLISGYAGSNDGLLALTRGEVDALSMPWSLLRIREARRIRDGEIRLLLQTGAEKEADLPHIPRMIDLARNDDERRLLELFSSPSLIGRSVLAPPGTPPERVAELRRAFTATMEDATFLNEVRRAGLEINPLPGEALQTAVARSGDFPPALIERARRAASLPGN